MRIKSFDFKARELAGSMGDFGTLFPLTIGYSVKAVANFKMLLTMTGS